MSEPTAGQVNTVFALMPPAHDTRKMTTHPRRRLLRWDEVVHKVDIRKSCMRHASPGTILPVCVHCVFLSSRLSDEYASWCN